MLSIFWVILVATPDVDTCSVSSHVHLGILNHSDNHNLDAERKLLYTKGILLEVKHNCSKPQSAPSCSYIRIAFEALFNVTIGRTQPDSPHKITQVYMYQIISNFMLFTGVDKVYIESIGNFQSKCYSVNRH